MADVSPSSYLNHRYTNLHFNQWVFYTVIYWDQPFQLQSVLVYLVWISEHIYIYIHVLLRSTFFGWLSGLVEFVGVLLAKHVLCWYGRKNCSRLISRFNQINLFNSKEHEKATNPTKLKRLIPWTRSYNGYYPSNIHTGPSNVRFRIHSVGNSRAD